MYQDLRAARFFVQMGYSPLRSLHTSGSCQNDPFQDAKDRKRTLLYGLLYTLSPGLSSFINPVTFILCFPFKFHTAEQ